MAANPGFPISLDVKGWPVLVIGGDDEAAEKTMRLLDAGAKVTAVSPVLNETMRKLAASAKIIHRGRHFRATDVESAVLVPQQGVTRDPRGAPLAMVVTGEGVVEPRMLEVDRTIGDQWLVTGGIEVGAKVIVEGLQKVRPGAKAAPVPFAPPQPGGDPKAAPPPNAPAPGGDEGAKKDEAP